MLLSMTLASAIANVILNQDPRPVPVQVVRTPLGWQMLRGGEPYFIRGVGGLNEPAAAVRIGANSARTWGIENLQRDLDLAQSQGMTLMLGIWLGHIHHGADYEDPKFQRDQLKEVEEMVKKSKNHPALLCYALGNEMEIFATPAQMPAIYRQVERLAKRIKELDPHHPVTTVTAGIDPEKAKIIQDSCPSLDFISVNAYEGMGIVGELLRQGTWTRPFVITEFGAEGQWESPMTSWGSPKEASSTAKGLLAMKNYQQGIEDENMQCLDSYTFLWWQKEKTTASWFGMQLQTGEKLEQTDQMMKAWTGRYPANRCPQVLELASPQDGKVVAPGSEIEAALYAVDPESDSLSYRWELTLETEGLKEAEKETNEARRIDDSLLDLTTRKIKFKAPMTKGAYKLYGYVRDGKGSAAFATMPFFVGL